MNGMILIEKIQIRQVNGLYCLNDLHRASGGENRHRPQYWLENKQTADLIDFLQADGIPSGQENQQVIHVLNGVGTFVCEELIYNYAAWVSPKFNALVYRTFKNAVQQNSGSLKQIDFSDPIAAAQAFIAAETQRRELQQQNQKLIEQQHANAPKVAFAQAVESSQDVILVRDLAKLLKQNGVDTGEHRLFAWLRDKHYLTRDNTPTQRSMNLGLFTITETVVGTPNGVKVRLTPKVTGKGQVYFINKFKQEMVGV